MNTEIQKKLRKIKSVSTKLRSLCTLLMVLVGLAGTGGVIALTFGIAGVNYDRMIFNTEGLPLGRRLLLGTVCALAFGALIKCFYHLRRLFGNYTREEIFTRESVLQLRQFGIACLFWGLLKFIWGLALVLSTHSARTVQGDADSFYIGIIIIVIAWFMDMAVDLREENELTI